ncbi:ureidoglycolate lyase [Salinisphaera sp.]|uniref:ureidoglycolate lyase n=1 Tax=Salinisphaera sp. TaxID=1914330 RepID=UPI002D7856AC|nr:ureidoglycolate lyase [Salinisphaera sp.]HET7315644.1 ureidoglycolate lyase [Salinisphaera sp.]
MSAQSHDDTAALTLTAVPLSPEAFAPFGDVIESQGPSNPINQGKGWRYPDLARVDVASGDGRTAISRVACVPEATPVRLRLMERHPLGSQAFIPVDGQRYIVVVAPAGEPPGPDALRAFVASGDQGINYHRGVWHHPMIALDNACDFLEVHRAGPGNNCDEVEIGARIAVRLPDSQEGPL